MYFSRDISQFLLLERLTEEEEGDELTFSYALKLGILFCVKGPVFRI